MPIGWYEHGVWVELTPAQDRAARRALRHMYGRLSIGEARCVLAGYRLALEEAVVACRKRGYAGDIKLAADEVGIDDCVEAIRALGQPPSV